MDKIVWQTDSGLTTDGTVGSLPEVQNTLRTSLNRASFPFDKAFQSHFLLTHA